MPFSVLMASFVDELEKLSAVKTPLQPHQERVVQRLQRGDQPGLVVVHGLGSGKTLTSIATQDRLGMPSTVVLPAALQDNYLKERKKHLAGSSPEAELTTLQRISRSGAKGLNNPMLIIDEAHRAREINSKAYQNLRDEFKNTKKRVLLTASPFYNRPSDIAPLINLAAGQKVLEADPREFQKRYVYERKVHPGFWGALRGAKPGVVHELNKKEEKRLREAFSRWVDYHPGSTDHFPEVKRETVEVPMTKKQLEVYDSLMGKAPAWVAFKVKAGLPPDKQEAKQLNAFINAVRQVSNTTRAYTSGVKEEPKIDVAFNRLRQTLEENPRAKGIVYSNYLTSGITPYKERLEAAGIPYGEFTGEMPKKQRDQLVRDYNTGKKRVLLLSSAGGEGLDLKGTRLVQVLEPHWNAEKLKQVEGRAIRYKSHDGLPEDERNVKIENYLAVRPPRTGVKALLLGKDPGGSADQYLTNMSRDKEKLIEQFKELLPKQGQ